eukprot:TRINITY_DN3891_c0_g1_i7.p1 TRINITY_DN3891_c0_g1~~TRINITY_DN3891_c0_g1_i7.p1  ORF type:complete len:144 (+),score=8.74 TRINITY_DN3891_c0_g1_i7:216-647(+)
MIPREKKDPPPPATSSPTTSLISSPQARAQQARGAPPPTGTSLPRSSTGDFASPTKPTATQSTPSTPAQATRPSVSVNSRATFSKRKEGALKKRGAFNSWKDGHYVLAQKGRSEERFSRNAETDLVCRLLLEKKKRLISLDRF